MTQGSAPWPPPKAATSDEVATLVHGRLTVGGVTYIHDVTVDGADPWHVTVTLNRPAPELGAAITDRLAPLDVDVVWYDGTVDAVAGAAGGSEGDDVPQPPEDDDEPSVIECGVCGGRGRWQHLLPGRPDGAVAVADRWLLCDVCHGLAGAGDAHALRQRMRAGHLPADQEDTLAQLLVESVR